MNKEELKQIRKELGLSQQDFAVRLGVGIATISRWEHGINCPSKLAMEQIKKINKGVK